MSHQQYISGSINYYACAYRFGFNGKEKDDEVKGVGNSLDFGARIYDSRTGRWLSVDPLWMYYIPVTPFNFALNNPITLFDEDGNVIVDSRGNKVIVTLSKTKDGSIVTNYNYEKTGKAVTDKYFLNNGKKIIDAMVVTKTGWDEVQGLMKKKYNIRLHYDTKTKSGEKDKRGYLVGSKVLGVRTYEKQDLKTFDKSKGVDITIYETQIIKFTADPANVVTKVGLVATHEAEHATEENINISLSNLRLNGIFKNDKILDPESALERKEEQFKHDIKYNRKPLK